MGCFRQGAHTPLLKHKTTHTNQFIKKCLQSPATSDFLRFISTLLLLKINQSKGLSCLKWVNMTPSGVFVALIMTPVCDALLCIYYLLTIFKPFKPLIFFLIWQILLNLILYLQLSSKAQNFIK